MKRELATIIVVLAAFASPQCVNASDLVIEHVTLIDGRGQPPLEDAWIAISSDKITSLGQGASPSATTKINGRGKYLLPGLIDSHVHIGGGRIRLLASAASDPAVRDASILSSLHGYLYSGVTTVYDSGNFPEIIFPLRDKERSGEILSPRILATGGVVAFRGGYGSGEGATIIGSADDLERLDQHLNYEPDMVKVLLDPQGRMGIPEAPIFSSALLKQVIDRVHSRGIRTTFHIPAEAEARMAIDAGADALAHLPARMDISQGFAAYARENGIPMSTTLAVFSNIARVAETPEMFETPLFQNVVSTEERLKYKTVERDRYISSGMSSFFNRMLPGMQGHLKTLYESGVVLALGTDRSVGPTVHQELELIVQSGVTPADALKMATYNAAIYLDMQAELGSIEEGKLADMILLSRNPIQNISNSRSIEMVIKAGKIIDLTSLDLPVNRKSE